MINKESPIKRFSAAWLVILASFNTWASERSLDIVAPWEIKDAAPATSGIIFSRMRLAKTLVDTDNQGQLSPPRR
ncbi:hypothetical protein [Vreelandella boliviensis]|uniref:Uncharacterized protein n=1 Tax=Vreelandella boliviensis LC1 TaxID=1072583 RepID=A0A265E3G0_9GAMM|nr:hypothetical protein [Halomonas boliviensis]EHJ93719.1 hypothetical protein KUC_0669 [Halomonas boliviensis LC1]OZT75778.1 hypothetical protein CE457_00695 [Halomonas boliviensis LC1]